MKEFFDRRDRERIAYMMKYLLKRLFCCHQYMFEYKSYKGNEQTGHTENEYGFRCIKCGKIHRVKVIR